MKIDQWVRSIIRYGFILLRFWMVATTEYETQETSPLLFDLSRLCKLAIIHWNISGISWIEGIAVVLLLFVSPYHFYRTDSSSLLRGESAILLRNALILQFILGRWLSFQPFNKGTASKWWWPLFFLYSSLMEIIFWRGKSAARRVGESWEKLSEQRYDLQTSPI